MPERTAAFLCDCGYPSDSFPEDRVLTAADEHTVFSPFRAVGLSTALIGVLMLAMIPWVPRGIALQMNVGVGVGLLLLGGIIGFSRRSLAKQAQTSGTSRADGLSLPMLGLRAAHRTPEFPRSRVGLHIKFSCSPRRARKQFLRSRFGLVCRSANRRQTECSYCGTACILHARRARCPPPDARCPPPRRDALRLNPAGGCRWIRKGGVACDCRARRGGAFRPE